MATPNRFIPTSLTAKNKPSWPARQLRKLITRIDHELYEQEQGKAVYQATGDGLAEIKKALRDKYPDRR